ncbi:histidine kinase [Herbiconiux sp. CPCC 205716]|uniref:Histidine kinase n=1 Tax=Herbiconiux gentiana TaxID=2970912 RepID=A0ABT2GJ42_9MICO|nr:ATP-binding protein [Herbiconiux gentiana]MCS5716234.1 histidine kinase [Herbiconiux gentiana]
MSASTVPLSRARIDLVLSRLQGLFGFAFALLSIPVLAGSASTLKPEWGRGVAVVLFGLIAVCFVTSLIGRGIRVSMTLFAGAFALALLLWPLAVRSPELALGTQPWLYYILIVAVGAAANALPTPWAVVYAIAVPGLFFALRLLPAGGGAPVLIALLDTVYSLVLGAFLVIVNTGLRSAADGVDEAQRTAVRRYAEAAKRHATEQERTRVDTVVHDRVLSTLLAASRAEGADDRRRVVAMAEQALVALQSADAESELGGDRPLGSLVDRLRALAGTITAEVSFHSEGDTAQLVPARVLEGIYSAAVQAVSNSVRHAGDQGVTRSVRVHCWGASGFSVVISDDGLGFVADEVPADRLGLRVSIRERVDAVGGSATVRSTPGEGTVVVLEWAPGAVPAEEALA